MREKRRRECERSYYEFVKDAWAIVHPGETFIDNWHYKVLCDELQSQIKRISRHEPKEYDLVVNIPPRSAKSTIIAICLLPWAWISFPQFKLLSSSYADSLSLEHSVSSRRLINSNWYQDNWGDRFVWEGDQNVKSFFQNDKGGYRITTSVGGSGTGRGGDVVLSDDPLSAQQADSEKYRKTANDWWDKTMFSRLNNQAVGLRVIDMQRLHEEDLTGHVLENGNYKHYCLPAEESDDIRPKELRKYYENGLLCPKLLPQNVLENAKKTLGSYSYAGQYQQRPASEEGGMFKKKFWRFWVRRGDNLPSVTTRLVDGSIHTHEIRTLPDKFDRVISSWDCTFKGSKGSDRVSGQTWALVDPDKYLLDQKLGQMDFLETKQSIINNAKQHPEISSHLIEDKANGSAVISELKSHIPGIIPVNPLGSKASRVTDSSKAMSMLAQAEAGNIILPHPHYASWVDDFIQEYSVFPMGKHDDQVDSGSQAINYLSTNSLPGMFS